MIDVFSFSWPAYQRPILTTPLPVENFLPWLTPQCDVAAPAQSEEQADDLVETDLVFQDSSDVDDEH